MEQITRKDLEEPMKEYLKRKKIRFLPDQGEFGDTVDYMRERFFTTHLNEYKYESRSSISS